MLQLVQHDMAQ